MEVLIGDDVGQDCTCLPTTASQPAPPSHLKKHKASTDDCKKDVEKGPNPGEVCSGHHDVMAVLEE